MVFNHNHLYYFYEVVKHGGVGNASNYLRLAQSSLSFQIKTLEDKIQRTLFQKIGRKLELTSEGKVVYSYCERMFGVVDELAEYLEDVDLLSQNKLTIGLTPDVERIFITEMLNSLILHQNDSLILLRMLESSHEINFKKLLEDRIDVFISNKIVNHKGIEKLSEINMPIVAISSSYYSIMHNLTNKETLIENLNNKDVKLVLPGESLSLRYETNHFLQKYRIKNRIIFESDIISSVISAVNDGLGIGFMPVHFVNNKIQKGKLVSFNNPLDLLWNHKIYLYGRENYSSHPLIHELKKRFNIISAQNVH